MSSAQVWSNGGIDLVLDALKISYILLLRIDSAWNVSLHSFLCVLQSTSEMIFMFAIFMNDIGNHEFFFLFF